MSDRPTLSAGTPGIPLDELLHQTSTACFIKDKGGRYTWVNAAAAQLLGHAMADVMGATDDQLFGEVAARQIREVDVHVMQERVRVTYQPTRRLHGRDQTFLTSKHPIYGPDGSVVGVAGVSTDVTQYLHERAEEEEQAVLIAMSRLASGLAHQINNPLMVLLETIEQVRGIRDLPDQARERLDAANRAAQRIERVVRDAQPRADDPSQNREDVAVGALLDEALHEHGHGRAVTTGLTLRGDLTCPVRVDRRRARRVLHNLFSHCELALGLSTSAPTPLRVTVERSVDHVVIALHFDDCEAAVGDAIDLRRSLGPDPDSPSASRPLDLWLAWRGARSLGGRLSSRSSTEDSVRRLQLVLPAPPQQASSPEAVAEDSPVMVLLVDDEESLVGLLQEALHGLAEVAVAHSGREALDLIQSGAVQPDLIVCDLMMPEMTGVELYAELEARGGGLAERMLFMTGGAYTADVRTFISQRKARVLKKPFRLSVLRSEVERTRAARSGPKGA